jgi:hypothetical protein
MEVVLLSVALLALFVGLGLVMRFMGRGMRARDSEERRVMHLLRAERLRMSSEFDRICRERTDAPAPHTEVGS